jgi:DNA polymerase-3 subunit alpha
MSQFAHLHLHTQYSFLDGAIKIKELMKRVKEKGMNAVAITDHGNLHGVIEFYETARKNDVKPIIGCELYLNPDGSYTNKDPNSERNHILLIAKNEEGYRNLIYLVSKAHLEGFYYVPRIDKKLLKEHSKGLIGASACLAGELNRLISKGQVEEAEKRALEYREIFEPDSFFIEIMRTGLPEQERNNPVLIDIARRHDIPLLATNDCHYLERDDARAHDILLCIQTDTTVEDSNRLHHDTDQYYLRTPEEMNALFSDIPDAVENAARIADMVNLELELNKPMLPDYEVPEGFTREQYLEKIAKEGLAERLKKRKPVAPEKTYYERLEYELKIINEKGFAGYFLIVQDFINYAKRNGIPVGPGRGSGAGSLVAYSIGITDLDPLRYGLLFERFLNPERKSLPDIDTDFCKNRRDEVINYVRSKYGDDRVCQIATFSELKAKSIIKDVARVLSIPYAEINSLTKRLPNRVGEEELTVDMAVKLEPRLAEKKELIEISRKLEGLNRQTGIHAAGVVISNKPLIEVAPLTLAKNSARQNGNGENQEGKEEKEVVIQFMKDDAEKAGLVKFDFLGLKTLTVIQDAVNLIRENEPNYEEFDINTIPMDDPAVFDLLSEGDTNGVFQCESPGFKNMLKRLKPRKIEELIAALALYRPGPLEAGLVDQYINRKNGVEKITYPHKKVEPILRETYGVIVYQEQVMNICVELCGWSMGKADSIRKAMGKKDRETMQKLSEDFIKSAISVSKMKEDDARRLWEQIEKFAGYAFNKSHSAAYAVISYQTAYLRTHFYKYFMCATLSNEIGDLEKISDYLLDLRKKGVKVLPPDINESEKVFSISGDSIRIGLLSIKGIGQSLAEDIIRERQRCRFVSFDDFVRRVKPNRKALESLIYAGALDFLGVSRPVLIGNIDRVLKQVQTSEKKKNSLALSFNCAESEGFEFDKVETSISEAELLKLEKDVIGFYVSKNPIAEFIEDIRQVADTKLSDIQTKSNGEEVTVGGMILRHSVKTGKNKERYATLFIEDDTGSANVYLHSRLLGDNEGLLNLEYPVIVTGTVSVIETDTEEGSVNRTVRINAREIKPLNEIRRQRIKGVFIDIPIERFELKNIFDVKKVISMFSGKIPVYINFLSERGNIICLKLDRDYWIDYSEQFDNSIKRLNPYVNVRRV